MRGWRASAVPGRWRANSYRPAAGLGERTSRRLRPPLDAEDRDVVERAVGLAPGFDRLKQALHAGLDRGTAELGDAGCHRIVAVGVSVLVHRLGHAVRVEKQPVARRELQRLLLVLDIGHEGDWKALGGMEFDVTAPGGEPDEGRMAARTVVEAAGGQMEHAVEEREVKPRKIVGLKEPVELRGDFGGPGDRNPTVRSLPDEQRLIGDLRRQEAAHRHRHQRPTHPIPRSRPCSGP